MILHRKHYQLAAHCARRRGQGYTVVLRVYQDCEHWKLAYKVFAGDSGWACEQQVIGAAETLDAIRELRAAFEAEMEESKMAWSTR